MGVGVGVVPPLDDLACPVLFSLCNWFLCVKGSVRGKVLAIWSQLYGTWSMGFMGFMGVVEYLEGCQ